MLMTLPLTMLTTATSAHAAEKCVAAPTEWAWYAAVGAPYYPVTLRDIKTHLYTGKQSAGAYARAYVPNGSYVSIDRSINAFSPTAAENTNGHGWRTNAQVTGNGGYDYCQAYHSGATGWTSTPVVQGRYHAVRPCLRVSGVLQCASMWYVDFDG
ncbi:hypothetical protein SLUN_17580 [Streptomyces lunaelactis]|uniref:Uncharacterized protein n=2 Tax=Streptomyces lunaelactis TaxID=1535768 RepID=A0A2R4T3M5_9ACTN|nr:hypothetical protein [Streptomyces lunaelactis]AVZ73718.1 hypothetical protein SLUN_17580 [Streptomyces lunaelactis]NUK86459.1 hypothetical protein [Streptomyces lunaelactis]